MNKKKDKILLLSTPLGLLDKEGFNYFEEAGELTEEAIGALLTSRHDRQRPFKPIIIYGGRGPSKLTPKPKKWIIL